MANVFLPQVQSVPHTGTVDEKFAALIRNLNTTLALLPWGVLQALSDQSGSLQFTKPLSMGKQSITNLAAAVADTDAVPLSQVQSLIAAALSAQLSSDDLHAKVKNTESEIATRATTAGNAEKLNGKQVLVATATIDFPLIGGGTTAQLTIPVPGAMPGDPCFVGAPFGLEANVIFCAYVSSAGVVTIRVYAPGVVDPISHPWTIAVLH